MGGSLQQAAGANRFPRRSSAIHLPCCIAAAGPFPSVPEHAGPVPLLARRGYKKHVTSGIGASEDLPRGFACQNPVPRIMAWIPFPAPPDAYGLWMEAT